MDVVKITQFMRRVADRFKRVGIYLSHQKVIQNTHDRDVLFPDVNDLFLCIPPELDVVIFSNIFTDEELQSIEQELKESGMAAISLSMASRNNDGAETVKQCTKMLERCMEECQVLPSDKIVAERCTTMTLLIVSHVH